MKSQSALCRYTKDLDDRSNLWFAAFGDGEAAGAVGGGVLRLVAVGLSYLAQESF
jgi:hypothetical protein